jgi:phosphoribosylanthranilate isomerase
VKISQKIKICGVNSSEIIAAINHNLFGFAGFIAYEKSPRFVIVQQYSEIVKQLNPQIKSVLVLVNPDEAILNSYITAHRPDFLQLHGAETIEFIQQIKAKFGLPIIKAIPVDDEMVQQIAHYQPHVDMLLFDTSHAGSFGGTGISFDWAMLNNLNIQIPYFLSGGIGVHNIKAALKTNADFIDVSSSLESQKGVKDVAKIQFFMDIVCQSE